MPRIATARMTPQRLSREDWLSLALETLAKQGQSRLTIDRLVSELGVTKGSFYWHFENRADFIQQLIEYWATTFTEIIVEQAQKLECDASERLYRLMVMLCENEVSRYDIAVRAWAAQDPAVAKVVKRVDKIRLGSLTALFSELGFTGDELAIRTHAFLYWGSFELGMFVPISKKESLRLLKKRHAFFVRP